MDRLTLRHKSDKERREKDLLRKEGLQICDHGFAVDKQILKSEQ